MARDIDFAAVAVEAAIRDKFGRQNDLAGLKVVALDKTISVVDGGNEIEGTRDNLLAAVRKASIYSASG